MSLPLLTISPDITLFLAYKDPKSAELITSVFSNNTIAALCGLILLLFAQSSSFKSLKVYSRCK
jgi:hypothetical protein